MSINKKFADIVFNSLDDVDEIGDDIILEAELYEPKLRFSPFSPIDLPQGYMIISPVSYTHLTLPTPPYV